MAQEESAESWRDQPPPRPAELIRDAILDRRGGMTQEDLADALHVSRGTVNRLMRDRQALSAEMALRLERLTSVSALTWLSIQAHRDLFDAEREHGSRIAEIEPLTEPGEKQNRPIVE